MPNDPLDYKGNSHKMREGASSRETKPVIEKVVTGEVVVAKRSFGQKFKGVFFGGEFKNAGRYVIAEVLLPALRNLMVDTTTKGVERMVYGERTHMRRPTQYSSRTSYSNPMMRRDRPYLPDQAPIARQVRRDTNDLILASRDEATLVLERLIDIVDKYNVASLADLYDLVGLPSSPVDNKWGWTYLNATEIRQVRDGYLLDLPPAEEI
jgi:hypothetical protein